MLTRLNPTQLEEILSEEIELPEFLTEENYLRDFKFNRHLRWKTNLRLHRYDMLPIFMNERDFRFWRRCKFSNLMLWASFIFNTVYFQAYGLLLFTPFYLFMINVLVGHRWLLIAGASALLLNNFLAFDPAYFWILFLSVSTGSVINHFTADRIDNILLRQAFSDIESFWRYYRARLIYIDVERESYFDLLKKYPQLRMTRQR